MSGCGSWTEIPEYGTVTCYLPGGHVGPHQQVWRERPVWLDTGEVVEGVVRITWTAR